MSLIVFSKMLKMMAVPPPGFHGTMSFAVSQENLGAAWAGPVLISPKLRATAAAAAPIMVFFMLIYSLMD